MATRPTNRRQSGIGDTITNLIIIGFISGMVYLTWPTITALFQARIASSPGTTQATSAPPRATTPPYQPPIAAPLRIPGLAQNAATAQAQFDAAVLAGEQRSAAAPVPNTDTTNDSAPVVRESAPSQQQHNVENVPTSEPIAQPANTDAFGSKPAPPVNLQATHTCLHGQVWTDSGCHNPTPVR